MNQMTFKEENGYIVCYINGKEVSRAKKASAGASTQDVIDIINDQIKANPDLSGTEPDLTGVEFSGDKYAIPEDTTYTAGNGITITEENIINADVKVLEVSNITGLTTEQCEALNVGDVVVKLTSNQKHTYTVSYKEAGVGMCLTYVDASTSETVSYDYVTNAWVYNSTDITPLKNIVANPTLAGTEADLTGLQVGETKYKVPQGGGVLDIVELQNSSGTLTQTQYNDIVDNNATVKYNDMFFTKSLNYGSPKTAYILSTNMISGPSSSDGIYFYQCNISYNNSQQAYLYNISKVQVVEPSPKPEE